MSIAYLKPPFVCCLVSFVYILFFWDANNTIIFPNKLFAIRLLVNAFYMKIKKSNHPTQSHHPHNHPNRATARLKVRGTPNVALDSHTCDIIRVNDPGRRFALSGASRGCMWYSIEFYIVISKKGLRKYLIRMFISDICLIRH